jgi:hypothetical protein
METSSLGPYRLLVCLAANPRQEVWSAQADRQQRRVVAVLRPGATAPPPAPPPIADPHLALPFDRGLADSKIAYVVHDLPGARTLLPGGSEDTLRQRVAWLRQACLGLHALHRRGCLHGEIDAGQVLVVHEGGKQVAKLLAPASGCTAPPIDQAEDVAALARLVLELPAADADLLAIAKAPPTSAHALAVSLGGWLEQPTRRRRLWFHRAALLLAAALLAVWILLLRADLSTERRELLSLQRRHARWTCLADSVRVERLRQRADQLWPELPSTVPAMRTWLADADRFHVVHLAADDHDHQKFLAFLRKDARESVGADGSRTWQFDDPEDEYLHTQLSSLVSDLQAFFHHQRGLVPEIRERLRRAESLEQESITTNQAAWDALRAVLKPQLGLVPKGKDASGNLVFLHLRSDNPQGGIELVLRDGAMLSRSPVTRAQLQQLAGTSLPEKVVDALAEKILARHGLLLRLHEGKAHAAREVE